MSLPTGIIVVMALLGLGGSAGFGFLLKHLMSTRDGVTAMVIERMGVNSNAKTEVLYYDWETQAYLFPTQNKDRVEARYLGGFNRIKHKQTFDKDDVLPIDQKHVLIGLKELNFSYQAEISRKDEEISVLQSRVDELGVRTAELETQLGEKAKEMIDLGHKSVIQPYLPTKTTRK